jgi:hypothetical protein
VFSVDCSRSSNNNRKKIDGYFYILLWKSSISFLTKPIRSYHFQAILIWQASPFKATNFLFILFFWRFSATFSWTAERNFSYFSNRLEYKHTHITSNTIIKTTSSLLTLYEQKNIYTFLVSGINCALQEVSENQRQSEIFLDKSNKLDTK